MLNLLKGYLGAIFTGWYSYATCVAIGLFMGLFGSHIYNGYLESLSAEKVVQQIQEQRKVDGKIAVDHANDSAAINYYYNDLRNKYAKLKEEKRLVSANCTLTTDAVKLWDASNQGVPTDSKAVVGEAAKAEDSRDGVEVPIQFAIKNKLELDNYHHQIEELYDKIIEWDKNAVYN